jgi:hypothetical protein
MLSVSVPDRLMSLAGQFRRGATAFFVWWLTEIGDMTPPVLKRAFALSTKSVVIHIAAGQATIRRYNRGVALETLHLPLDTGTSKTASIRSEAALVALAPEVAFLGRFHLPVAAQARLREAVTIEVGRRSPFRGSDALIDYAIRGKSDDGRTLEIEWATVPARLIQDMKAAVHRLGFHALAIGIAPGGKSNLDYAFTRQGSLQIFRPGLAASILALSLLLCAGSWAYAIHSRMELATKAGEEVETLKTEAEAARKEESAAEAWQTAIDFVNRRASEPDILDVLRATTEAIPWTSWVTEFNLSGNQLRLAGLSAAASGLPELLAANPLFEHVQFRAPITPENNPSTGSGMDHFDIGLTVRNRHAKGDPR